MATEPKARVFAYTNDPSLIARRDWYAGFIDNSARIEAALSRLHRAKASKQIAPAEYHPQRREIEATAWDVVATYNARFSPALDPVGPGEWTAAAFATDADLSGSARGRLSISWDVAGGYVRDAQGYVVRDPRKVARLVRSAPADIRELALSVLPARIPGRRRRDRHNVARALLFANISPELGLRPTARLLLAWEQVLGAPWRASDVGELAERFDSGERLAPEERQRLMRAENTMITECKKALESVPEMWRSLASSGVGDK